MSEHEVAAAQEIADRIYADNPMRRTAKVRYQKSSSAPYSGTLDCEVRDAYGKVVDYGAFIIWGDTSPQIDEIEVWLRETLVQPPEQRP